jgi:hypothetical protein
LKQKTKHFGRTRTERLLAEEIAVNGEIKKQETTNWRPITAEEKYLEEDKF